MYIYITYVYIYIYIGTYAYILVSEEVYEGRFFQRYLMGRKSSNMLDAASLLTRCENCSEMHLNSVCTDSSS